MLEQAWQCFAAGDAGRALQLAQEAHVKSPQSPHAAATLGYFLLEAGQHERAGAVLHAARADWPQDATLSWYLGLLELRKGHADLGIAYLRQACQLNPGLHEAAFALAWALHDQGQPQQALGWARHALALQHNAAHLLLTGWLLQCLGHYAEAASSYQAGIACCSGSGAELRKLHLHLADCQRQLGQLLQAQETLGAGLERFPDDADLLMSLAHVEWRLGRGDAALDVARRLTGIYPDHTAGWHLLGSFLQDTGDWAAADRCFNEVQQRDLSLTDALFRRAQIQARAQRPADALWLLQQVLRQQPECESGPAKALLAQVLMDMQQYDEARRLLLAQLRMAPAQSELWRLLAVAQGLRGRPRPARRALARALRLDPANVEAWRLQVWQALEDMQLAQAEAAARHLLALRPQDAYTHVQAAFVFAASGNVPQAAFHAESAVLIEPDSAEAWRALSQARYQQQRLTEAEDAIDTALRLAPDRPDSLRQLGWILVASQRFGMAELAFLHACEVAPEQPAAWLELAEVRLRAGQFSAGLQALDQGQVHGPLGPRAVWVRLQLLVESGRWDESVALCRRLLMRRENEAGVAKTVIRLLGLGADAARPLTAMLPRTLWRETCQQALNTAIAHHGHSCLVRMAAVAREDFPDAAWIGFACLYVDSLRQDSDACSLSLAARHAYRALKLQVGLAPTWGQMPARQAGARPRLAYVVGQPHARLLQRVLASHDPAQVEVFIFTSQPLPGLPAHLRCLPLDLEQLARSCAANQIDVLIDTGGLQPFEGQYALLELYARRLAPLQVGWLGSWGSSGGLFDVLLTDRTAVALADERHYEEAIWALDGGQWCWAPPDHAPVPQSPPSSDTDWITLGVVARGLRLNDSTLASFAAVMRALPLSRLRFIGTAGLDWPQQTEILSRLQVHGVAADRVCFDPPRSYEGLLAWFQQVDIVLDSFPGNGGLGLLDALWMGVPVITRAGQWAGARQGASILKHLGLQAWVADSEPDFVSKAIALARDLPARASHRAGLRQRMQNSPLLDGRRIARQIEQRCVDFACAQAAAPTQLGQKAAVRAHARRTLQTWLDKAVPLQLPCVPESQVPDLSVIIILYNQAGLSLRTLQALADQRDVCFETIIIDNASADETGLMLQHVRGARVVRNTDNIGFLLAANQGAAMALGRHLLFLNNDAIVQQHALATACQRLDADASIGALGGRIVLSAGGLQEAGNAIFRDGSTAGAGRGEDPFSPAALASRPTDYCSGVFLATPRRLWCMLNGFDTALAPAYYEDTDFCLRVWQAGFRVIYEPRVLVEHLEWGSAGNGEAEQRMRDNRRLFQEKHRDWLRLKPQPCRLSLDDDLWQSPLDVPRKPRILILDNEVPLITRGGGLPRARLMLHALRDWPVTFYPLWGLDEDWTAVYASVPDSTQVMLGMGMGQLESFLERRRGIYDVLWVSRPPNLQAIAPLRSRRPELFAGMRLVYDSEALFALREIGEAAVKGMPMSRSEARAHLQRELDSAGKVDRVVVVSERDAAPFRAAGHDVAILSHALPVRRTVPCPAQREGLLFVGALYPDTPNEDGLLWFAKEVMPRLAALVPVLPPVYVVGGCRSSRVAELAGPHFQILGAQEDLRPHYDRARVFIAPVRYAGGVPVKVIEAAAQGIPVVASAILARQLGWQPGIEIQSARDAAAFAQAIALLLRDDGLWLRQQQAAWAQCAAHYHPDNFAHDVRALMMPPEQVHTP